MAGGNFQLIQRGLDVEPLRRQLAEHSELWGAHRERQAAVHREMTDIWVRYRAYDELKEPKNYLEPHWGVFYPAWDKLPALRPLVFDLMRRVEAVHLGAILITRIPAGGMIHPHDDRGSWHAEFHNCKIYVPVQTNENCVNICGYDRKVMRVGEAWRFDNLVMHSVENDGDEDRMTLIICTRVEG